MANLIAETNGTRAIYRRLDGHAAPRDSSVITLPVIAWDADGFALVAHNALGRLIRAEDADVYEDGYVPGPQCHFIALDAGSATGPIAV